MIYTGGCACGRLRFAAAATPVDSGYCHCATCRRTTGAPLLAYASFPVGSFAYTQGAPARFASSVRGVREFCDRCGTQIAFVGSNDPLSVDVNVGALDDPESCPPRRHLWCEAAISWLHMGDALPRHRHGADSDTLP